VSMPDAVLGADLMRRATEADCCRGPDRDLLRLLREDAPIYAGRGAVESERLRAFVMECVSNAGLAPEAWAFIREELETGMDPYAVAAAARAVRSLPSPPRGIERLLRGAADRISAVDETVWLASYPAPQGAAGPSAVAEVMETLAIVGRLANDTMPPICADQTSPKETAVTNAIADLADVELEDQDGRLITFAELFSGRAGVISFFYTRCMNPNKCSRTIARLGALRDLVGDTAVVVAGITYDPAYDLPERLRRYGEVRGFRFGPLSRLLRTTGSFEPIRRALELGVGYGAATVNRHAVELFVIDPTGRLSAFERQLWNEQDVAAAVLGAEVG
jgi:cytochrome oxidase Cu insertion factor (SCO1/SenC/PrrC family)